MVPNSCAKYPTYYKLFVRTEYIFHQDLEDVDLFILIS